jgi:hypothetical protein
MQLYRKGHRNVTIFPVFDCAISKSLASWIPAEEQSRLEPSIAM